MNQARGAVVSGIDTSRRFIIEELKGDENHVDEEGVNLIETIREHPALLQDDSAA
jgi:hypothetical protein